MNAHGIVLFGHGARDPRWAEPFERLAARLRAAGSAAQVSLAFLELMTPSLDVAVAAQIAAGCTRVTVVPVFFGQGGHVRRDLPQLIDACRAAHPGVEIRCATAVGEDDGVLDAIARYCIDQLERDA
ncbi:sirohydrochlorin chelatase [Burkholderia multivorans]|jgi:sirohydrochlorin cobaltochelatase|uniref:CbiX/SirB N-terminal domain-containing protein n=1 Tax=Burkholderia multivorans TaxID=87883 RepID=A0A8E2RYR3_9BURK|nr:CbiX/SirB N-terminal domain-containing protein [Burkholderia multivorans]KOE27221.1 cobalamin biosynthesis protein CbiX [Burkholderia multivorans R-20526]KVS11585.1 cobalamin biosynthesis protein CbiX [Burkholderia multivorans]MBH9661498.1 CbiX/SirB N-terminal domain-containing protein [Burkholderia multivorans]MBU9245327.1 CbiX/SirB N-terminal domain-containing protein [Burkholderia multivorans]MBU9250410.1 CbiX/SirB N-terminal domain-containing protein [Burkholderia multivorans]